MTRKKPHPRSRQAAPPAPPALLNYAVATVPSPLQPGETGAVILTVTPIAAPVYCDQIILSVEVGSDSDCLFQAATLSAAVSPTDWSHNPVKIVPGADAGAPAPVLFSTDDPDLYEIDYPFTLTLQGQVGTSPGSFPIAITETSGATDQPGDLTARQGGVAVNTGSANFYLENFIAKADGASTSPCTEFLGSATVTLSWESNGSSFALWRKNESSAFWTNSDTPPETTATFTGPVTDTTYFLVATSPGIPPTLYDALTVTVSNPDLTPNTVVVAGMLQAAGLATLQGGASVSQGASIGGGLTVEDTGLTVDGSLTVRNGGGWVSGGLSTDALRVSGLILANDSIAVDNDLTANRVIAEFMMQAAFISVGPPTPARMLNVIGVGSLVDTDLGVLAINNPNSSASGNYITGLQISIGSNADVALAMNGLLLNESGVGTIVRVAGARAERLYTSPLSRQIELHLSGSARLIRGEAAIVFDEDSRDAMAPSERYLVQVTPAGLCRGLAVVARDSEGFQVRECFEGESNVEFDWQVIARKRASPDSNDPHELPATLPRGNLDIAPFEAASSEAGELNRPENRATQKE